MHRWDGTKSDPTPLMAWVRGLCVYTVEIIYEIDDGDT